MNKEKNNNILILTTTKSIGSKEAVFGQDSNNLIELENGIVKIKEELIFAHPLIIKEKGEKSPEVINEKLIAFLNNVCKYLEEKELNVKQSIKHILFFIHAKELGLEITSILEAKNEQSKQLKNAICSIFEKVDCHILAFVHEEKYYFGEFIYQTNDIKEEKEQSETSSWSEFLLKAYEKDKRNNSWFTEL